MTISIPLRDFAPETLICLADRLRQQYRNRNSISAFIFSEHDAAENYLPPGSESSALKTRWASKMHAEYLLDADKHAAHRHLVNEQAPELALTNQQTSLAFDLVALPNNKSHIVGPGKYQLHIVIAASNANPVRRTLEISVQGTWDADETRMLRDGVGVRML